MIPLWVVESTVGQSVHYKHHRRAFDGLVTSVLSSDRVLLFVKEGTTGRNLTIGTFCFYIHLTSERFPAFAQDSLS